MKRGFPVIVLVLLAVAANFQASGIAQLLGTAVGPRQAMAATARPRRPARPIELEKRPSAQAILDRNPFDSTYSPHGDAPPVADDTPGAPGADWYADPACDKGRVVLIASSGDPAWSFAALAGGDGGTILRRQGDDFGGAKVAFVGDHRDPSSDSGRDGASAERVWLTAANGTRCQLALGVKPVVAAAPAKAPAAPASPLVDKIKKRGDRAYDVDRSALEALVANPAELMKVRVVPVKEGDRVVGLGLQGIKPGSVLAAIGLESGDTLSSINGFEMTDPTKMLEAYTKLMTADHLQASVVRGGKPVSIDIAIK